MSKKLMNLSEHIGDEAIAEALRIAERRLTTLGWRYSDKDIGTTAAVILSGLDNLTAVPSDKHASDTTHE